MTALSIQELELELMATEQQLGVLKHACTVSGTQQAFTDYQNALKHFASLWFQLREARGKEQFLTVVQDI
jgi:hypothetical protein